MARQPGTAKTGGRKAGTPNKLTRELRDVLKHLVFNELEQLPAHLETLKPSERIEVLIKLLPYTLPRINTVQPNDGEPWDVLSL